MLVRDWMQREVVTVTPDDTLATALELTREHRVRHLPVVLSGGGLAGLLSDRDIRLAMPSPLTTADAERHEFLERTAIAGIMTRDVITTGAEETIEEAAKQLYRHRIGSLPVVAADGRLEGIITETDILHAFVRILGVVEPSTRIEVALEDLPGELGRALTVIGEAVGLNVVSAIVPPLRDGGRKTAILNVATIDPREAIAALRSAGFPVGWPSLERNLAPVEESPLPR
ncbi:MAG TPA: CBS and ACT domain-containing protein [Longimicrobiaceae bacterium]|nr:CBS and ACT domain-containing protein [Longimicrobiaceae bacterium]